MDVLPGSFVDLSLPAFLHQMIARRHAAASVFRSKLPFRAQRGNLLCIQLNHVPVNWYCSFYAAAFQSVNYRYATQSLERRIVR